MRRVDAFRPLLLIWGPVLLRGQSSGERWRGSDWRGRRDLRRLRSKLSYLIRTR
ncbi:hypothetical protein LINPERHAP2_LOCUS14109 [Linum perenne]